VTKAIKKKSAGSAVRRKPHRPRGGGKPPVDDSGIIESIGLLMVENRWLREHNQKVDELDVTSAIRNAMELSYETWMRTAPNKEIQISQGVQRIRPKLSKRLPDGKTVLDSAIERAATRKTIWGTPATQTILTTPHPPAIAADTNLIYEFLEALDALTQWGHKLSNERYTILNNEVRDDLKAFMACFKKITKYSMRNTI